MTKPVSVCTRLIAVVCSMTKQVSVCTRLIAVVCNIMKQVSMCNRERSGSVVECLTQDRRAVG